MRDVRVIWERVGAVGTEDTAGPDDTGAACVVLEMICGEVTMSIIRSAIVSDENYTL